MSLPLLRLKKNEDRRLRAGHLWIYSNEIDVARTPLKELDPGQQVEVQSSAGRSLGSAYVNPHSLICGRLVSREGRALDRSLLVHRLKMALSLRERVYHAPFYRLVHGEGDFLPGLVVDRYDDVLVVQITTAGMEVVKEAIIEALEKVVRPRAILVRNDSAVRQLEGLEQYVETPVGEEPEWLEIREDDVSFRIDPYRGQKTGWFFDQRGNRDRLAAYARGGRVLDLFSYAGGWGVRAAAAGASEAVCVDSSPVAMEAVERNATRNGLDDRVRGLRGDVFDVLARLREDRERFDVVVCDPPAFIKRRRDAKAGAQAYRRLNQMAMQVLAKDGILISCSCSYHYPREQLQRAMLGASRHLDRNLQVLEHGGQGVDHPVHPAIPETDYLKAIVARVTPAG